MPSPYAVSASPCGHRFDYQCFSHGRIFRRYHGSEACRFSPDGAFILLARLCRDLTGPFTLWDPFCGTGLIPGIAAGFFAHRVPSLVVSDILPEAAPCALGNLLMFRDDAAMQRRMHEIEVLGRPSLKHRERWSAVGEVLARPAISPRARPASIIARVVAAQDAPRVRDERLLLIGDLPYGRASPLHGATEYGACLEPLLRAHPQARAAWIAPIAQAEVFRRLADGLGRACALKRFRGGRVQAHLAPVGERLDERDELGAPSTGAAGEDDAALAGAGLSGGRACP